MELIDLEHALKTRELRGRFLRYTREAYALLPALDRPRILDVGCGWGAPTIELARLGGGEIVGIDTDLSALAELRRRIQEAGLGQRIKVVAASLLDAAFADETYDVLWEEGVLHLLDPARSMSACRRLLKAGGILVVHETVGWFTGIEEQLPALGIGAVSRLLLPKRCWWTDYYAPLQDRIRLLREERGEQIDPGELARHEREIAMVKADPDRFDCGFFVLRKL